MTIATYDTLSPMTGSYQLCADGIDGPTDRSYWVVEGRFAAGGYPSEKGYTGSGPTPEKLELLVDAGIDMFINLTQDYPGGTDVKMSHYDPGLGGSAGIVRFPIPDEHLPACPLGGDEARETTFRMRLDDKSCPHCPNEKSISEMKKILDRIDTVLDVGQNVYVHCWGGSGRTGTVVGCWLRRHGLFAVDEVLEGLQELRQAGDREGGWKKTPDTFAQAEFIVAWGEGE